MVLEATAGSSAVSASCRVVMFRRRFATSGEARQMMTSHRSRENKKVVARNGKWHFCDVLIWCYDNFWYTRNLIFSTCLVHSAIGRSMIQLRWPTWWWPAVEKPQRHHRHRPWLRLSLATKKVLPAAWGSQWYHIAPTQQEMNPCSMRDHEDIMRISL